MRVVGVVVAVDYFAGRLRNSSSKRVYTVDDSSGVCIEALIVVPAATGDADSTRDADRGGDTRRHSADTQAARCNGVDVGAVVDVRGRLSTFRGERQINVEKMVQLRSTEQELALWEKRAKFRRDVLDKPWMLRERDVRKCRKEAERSDARNGKRPEPATKRHGAAGKQAPAKNSLQGKVAGNLKDMIRRGVLAGKYDALGL